MQEVKDPEIKLFGKKICLSDSGEMIHAGEEYSGVSGGSSCEFMDGVQESGTENEDEKIDPKSLPEESKQQEIVEVLQNNEAVSIYEDNPDSATSMDEGENDQGDTNHSQEKTLKKPDKIIPCPRCKSMDTKFCYYNNYNVNQPRHFCKSCQRYWTAGGSMRNVPVGAGRRKNKSFASHCHYEALQAAQMDVPNGFYNTNSKPNGTILSFGQELPLCDPVFSVLNLTDKNTVNCSSSGQQEPALQPLNGFSSLVPYFPGVPWPFPWNSAVPMPAFCPPGYHMPIYPTPLWNCNVNGGAWSFPWLPPNSSTLAKHSRSGEVIRSKDSEGGESQEPKSSEGSILVPKTLRIDDPEEAAKSSIWTTLGIKYDSMSNKGGGFKAFEQKTNEKKCLLSTPPALQLNPAALSRSHTFQESA